MIRNVGTIDRLLRVSAGVVLLGLSLMGVIGSWGFVGIVPLVTGLVGNCPLYAIFGLKTCANTESSGPRSSP
jgi:Protein of unknown function (DUF2892)